jgi:hypothetical protein
VDGLGIDAIDDRGRLTRIVVPDAPAAPIRIRSSWSAIVTLAPVLYTLVSTHPG